MVNFSTIFQALALTSLVNGAVHRLPSTNGNIQLAKRQTNEAFVTTGNYTADPDSLMGVEYTFNNLAEEYLANQNNVTSQLVGFSTLMSAITHDAAGMVLQEIAQNQEAFFAGMNASATSVPTITAPAWQSLGENVATFVNAASTWSDSLTPNNTVLVNAIYTYITSLQQWGGLVFNSTVTTAAPYASTISTSMASSLSSTVVPVSTTTSTSAVITTSSFPTPTATVSMTPVPTTSSTSVVPPAPKTSSSVAPPPPPPTTTSSAASAPSAPAPTGLAVYWGNTKKTETVGLAQVCTDDKIDIVIVNFAANVSGAYGAWGPSPAVSDLTDCQTKYKKRMFISIGGWTTDLNTLATADDGTNHAELIWNMYGGGQSSARPFGSFVFDGFDLDIEHLPGAFEGNQENTLAQTVPIWPAFLQKLRDLSSADKSKTYYLSGAPYGSWADPTSKNVVTNAESYKLMDYVWPQFYVGSPGDHGGADFGTTVGAWAALLKAANPNTKLYIGTPGSAEAVMVSGTAAGWVFDTVQPALNNDVKAAVAAAKQYGNLGGYMLWDGSEAIANNNFQDAVKAALVSASS